MSLEDMQGIAYVLSPWEASALPKAHNQCTAKSYGRAACSI